MPIASGREAKRKSPREFVARGRDLGEARGERERRLLQRDVVPLTPDPATWPESETVPPQVTTGGNAFSVIPDGLRGVVKLVLPLRRTPAEFVATTRQ